MLWNHLQNLNGSKEDTLLLAMENYMKIQANLSLGESLEDCVYYLGSTLVINELENKSFSKRPFSRFLS